MVLCVLIIKGSPSLKCFCERIGKKKVISTQFKKKHDTKNSSKLYIKMDTNNLFAQRLV